MKQTYDVYVEIHSNGLYFAGVRVEAFDLTGESYGTLHLAGCLN